MDWNNDLLVINERTEKTAKELVGNIDPVRYVLLKKANEISHKILK